MTGDALFVDAVVEDALALDVDVDVADEAAMLVRTVVRAGELDVDVDVVGVTEETVAEEVAGLDTTTVDPVALVEALPPPDARYVGAAVALPGSVSAPLPQGIAAPPLG